MRLPGRIAAAIEVLTDLETRRRPASDALRDWGLSHRFAGAGDRAAIGNLVYDALRRRASHAFAMKSDTGRALTLSVAVRDWGENPQVLSAGFAEDKFAPEVITDDEMALLTAPNPLADAPDAVRADLPDWLAPLFAGAFGADWVAEGQALTDRPPLDLRVNALKADRGKVEKALRRFSPQTTEFAPLGLRLPAGPRDARTPNVQADESYLKGWVEVQDQGSQIVSLLAGAQPGMQVLDLCAGAGGKTLAMAAEMGNKGQIFAHDSERQRLAPIYDRLKRAGVRNVQVRPPQQAEPGKVGTGFPSGTAPKGANAALDDLAEKMDLVLVDAPCTGTGTWRRRPDAKWRLSPEQIEQRCAEQAAILKDAARYVKPGGRLVYITCSLLPPENGQQVETFLNAQPNFASRDLQSAISSRLPALNGHWRRSGDGIILTPRLTGTDGFFIAALERKS